VAPEIREFAGAKAAIALVSTKTDARFDAKVLELLRNRGQAPVTTEQGAAFAKTVGATAFVACSAFTTEGLKETVEAAVRTARAQRAAVRQPKRAIYFITLLRWSCLPSLKAPPPYAGEAEI
jgi:GTPase SAR1 family protein